jgi:hypothetical protein
LPFPTANENSRPIKTILPATSLPFTTATIQRSWNSTSPFANLSVGLNTGIPRVGFSHTVPVPANTIPMQGIYQYDL